MNNIFLIASKSQNSTQQVANASANGGYNYSDDDGDDEEAGMERYLVCMGVTGLTFCMELCWEFVSYP